MWGFYEPSPSSCGESDMFQHGPRILKSAFALFALFSLVACASNSDLDALRTEVSAAREAAERAATEAQEASAQAQAASDKADRIYQQSLRK